MSLEDPDTSEETLKEIVMFDRTLSYLIQVLRFLLARSTWDTIKEAFLHFFASLIAQELHQFEEGLKL